VSREVIADSIELVCRGHLLDGLVAIAGCDKTIPASAMALLRLDIPALVLYSGSIMAGEYEGRKLTIQDVYESVGALHSGRITAEQLHGIESHTCPGAGACGGQFTANTMSTAFEMLGISPMGMNGVPAEDPRKNEVARECGCLVMKLLASGLTPRQIVTRKAPLNAIAGVVATK
jgi:dihydroxy-acid dehydratase